MTDRTPHLDIAYLAPAQAQKHLSVNAALQTIDAVAQLCAISASVGAQPATPAEGDVYLLPVGKTGAAWSLLPDHAVATFIDGAWTVVRPEIGWRAHVADADAVLMFVGWGWTRASAAQSFKVFSGDRLVGRYSAGEGPAEEIVCTAAGRALIDDADAAAQRVTLGLANAALLDAVSVWSGVQTFPNGTIVGSGSGVSNFYIDGGPTSGKQVVFRTAGVARMSFRATEAESGGNTGSNFMVTCFDDAGSVLGTGLRIARATRDVECGAKVLPLTDNANSCGSASRRWSEVFAATGAINTSDAREKTSLMPIPESAKRAVRAIMAGVGVFQWRDAVAEKGEAGARLHVGVTAQAVRDAFLAEGEDPARWALFCADPVMGEAGPALDADGAPLVRLGVRTDQLLLLALAAL